MLENHPLTSPLIACKSHTQKHTFPTIVKHKQHISTTIYIKLPSQFHLSKIIQNFTLFYSKFHSSSKHKHHTCMYQYLLKNQ